MALQNKQSDWYAFMVVALLRECKWPGDGGVLNIGKMISKAEYFNGSLDDVRIYNRALSEAEVKALYEYEKP